MGNSFTVYKHTTPSNKVYIGITSQKETHRWGRDGHGYYTQAFGNAVRKYGWDNIQHEIICTGISREEAVAIERRLIAEYHADNSDSGYNCTSGGFLCEFNEETKEKISKALTGRRLSEEHRKNISKGSKGHLVSEETRKKIGEKHRGKRCDEELRKRLRDAHEWQAKRVAKYSLTGELIEVFNSVGDAAKATGCSKYLIRRVCQGKRKTTCGYMWTFIEGGD